jgi:hypothetical protein
MLDFSHSMPLGEVELLFEGDDHQPILHAFLKKIDGERKEARINLSERIGNEDGKFVFSRFILFLFWLGKRLDLLTVWSIIRMN